MIRPWRIQIGIWAAIGAACAACFGIDGAASARAQYTTFQVDGLETYGRAVNGSGTVGGIYWTSRTTPHGYVRTRDGAIVKFDPEGSKYTDVTGIDRDGTIIGYFEDGSDVNHGYIRPPTGEIAVVDPPASRDTLATGIAKGTIVGSYLDNNGEYGFSRAPNGTFTAFVVPGAVDTLPSGVNAHGTTVGSWVDPGIGAGHGFARAADGTITTFDPPGAQGSVPVGIDGSGTVAGYYSDSSSQEHAFIRAPDGTFTEFDVPDSVLTEADAIDKKGDIVGFYDFYRHGHRDRQGFVRSAGGEFKKIRVQGSSLCYPESIASTDGRHTAVTGFCLPNVPYGPLVGFLRTN